MTLENLKAQWVEPQSSADSCEASPARRSKGWDSQTPKYPIDSWVQGVYVEMFLEISRCNRAPIQHILSLSFSLNVLNKKLLQWKETAAAVFFVQGNSKTSLGKMDTHSADEGRWTARAQR